MREFNDGGIAGTRTALSVCVTIHTDPVIRLSNLNKVYVTHTNGERHTYIRSDFVLNLRGDQLDMSFPHTADFYCAVLLDNASNDEVMMDAFMVGVDNETVADTSIDYIFKGHLNKLNYTDSKISIRAGIRARKRKPGLIVSASTGFNVLPPIGTRLVFTDGVIVLGHS